MNKKVYNIISAIVLLALTFGSYTNIGASAISLPAFPGAQGFGALTAGGRGGQVIKVTNLNDSGPGSLRNALTASGPRIVVFDIGGTINLSSTIKITNPYLTVAGQTAPGDGILIRGPYAPGSINGGPTTLEINTHDVVIRGLRIREANRAAIALYANPSGGIYNIIIDHNSLSWSTDSVLDMWYNPHDVTYSWNIISEPVGSHNYGMLIGGYDDCTTPGYNISIHHNLFSQNSDRNPRINQKIGSPELVNNVVYNWNWYGTRTTASAAIIGNHYIAGKNTVSSRPIYVQEDTKCSSLQPASVYVSHNIGQGRTTDTGDDWSIVDGGTSKYRTDSPPFTLSGITIDNVMDVKAKILAGAGAIIPSRDSVDVRVVNDVKNGTGGYLVSSPNEVGGWPILKSGTAAQDNDNDGMPDAWEQAHGGNLSPIDISPSRYTWVEEYINSLIPNGSGSSIPTAPPTVSSPPTPTSAWTNTPLPATASPVPASATPTASLIPASPTPTASSIPIASPIPASPTPTASPIPVSPTTKPVQPSITPTASAVPVQPTSTLSQPSATPIAATAIASTVPVLPTSTPVQPTATVPVLPTSTSVQPTATVPVLPTLTSVQPVATAQQQNPLTSETIYDDKNGSFVYSADWRDVAIKQASGGSFKKTNEDGSLVTFTFTGQSFSVIYTSGPKFGKVKVYIDGNLVKTIDENERASGYQKRWNYPGQLSLSKHTLTLIVETPNGSIDAVAVR